MVGDGCHKCEGCGWTQKPTKTTKRGAPQDNASASAPQGGKRKRPTSANASSSNEEDRRRGPFLAPRRSAACARNETTRPWRPSHHALSQDPTRFPSPRTHFPDNELFTHSQPHRPLSSRTCLCSTGGKRWPWWPPAWWGSRRGFCLPIPALYFLLLPRSRPPPSRPRGLAKVREPHPIVGGVAFVCGVVLWL